jgi:riboflavin synthase alpha subunit
VGHHVNIEVDLIARYLERLHRAGDEATGQPGGVSAALLAEHGFK